MKLLKVVMFALCLCASTARADWTDDVQQITELIQAGNYAGADQAASESLRRGPGFMLFSGTGTLNIHYQRGYARLVLGNTSGAIEDADVIIKENTVFFPSDMGLILRGMAKTVAGDAKGGLADFQAALDVDKSTFVAMRNYGIYGNRGIANFLLGNFPAADADLFKAIEADHDTSMLAEAIALKKKSWSSTRTAIAKLNAGDAEGARESAMAARNILMARNDIAPGDLVSAQLVLNKLQKTQTEKVAAREEESLMLAQQQLSRGDRSGAFQTYVRAFAELGSESARDKAFEGIALIYPALPVKPGLPEEARRYLVQSRVYVEDKNLTQAIALYDKAIALAPWWPSSHFDRGLLLGQIGKNEEAIVSMKRFLLLAPTSENARDGQDKIYEWELKLSQQQAARERREQSGGMSATLNQQGHQSDCFIATAAYGSAMDPHVAALRHFRDTSLLTNAPGRWLVERYYAWSPPAADFIRERDGLRAVVRVLLGPLVLAVLYPWQAMAIVGMALVLAVAFRRRSH